MYLRNSLFDTYIHTYRVYLEEFASLLQDIFELNNVDITKHNYIQNCKVAEIMKTECFKNGNIFKLIDYQTHKKWAQFVVSVILKSVLNI